MGRGTRIQSRPIGPIAIGPRAGRASGPWPTASPARAGRALAARGRLLGRRGGLPGGRAAYLPWVGGPRPPGLCCPTSRGLAPAPPASPRALPPRPAVATARPGRAWCFSSVYQCGQPCLLRPAPRRAPPTSSTGPAGHRTRPPRLVRCDGAHRHQPNRLSAAAATRAQRALGSGPGAAGVWRPLRTGQPHLWHGSGARRRPSERVHFFSEGHRSRFRTLARAACGTVPHHHSPRCPTAPYHVVIWYIPGMRTRVPSFG